MSSYPYVSGVRTPSLARLASVAAVMAAGLAGVIVAQSPALGAVAMAAALFGPIALIDLPLALTAFAATLFLRNVPGVGLGSTMAGIVVAFAWLGVVANRTGAARVALGRLRGLVAVIVALLLWLLVTLAWATDVSLVFDEWGLWALSALLLVIVATSADSERRVRAIAGGYVVGALLSVVYGIATGDLTEATTAVETAAEDARFSTVADPNDLAAGLVPAVAVLLGLLPGMRRGPGRPLAGGAVVLLLVGLAATQSRGGYLAAATAVLAAVLFARGRRIPAFIATVTVSIVAIFILSTTPGAMDRVTSLDNGGSGRSDIWWVAGQMFADHPLAGVGLNHFRTEAGEYANRPGQLDSAELIVETPKIVHNTYLQMLAEGGMIGLLLLLAVIGICVGATFRASTAYSRAGRRDMSALAQGVLAAQIALLAACFFLSIGDDLRLWLLLGFGPALLALARRPTPVTLDAPFAR